MISKLKKVLKSKKPASLEAGFFMYLLTTTDRT